MCTYMFRCFKLMLCLLYDDKKIFFLVNSSSYLLISSGRMVMKDLGCVLGRFFLAKYIYRDHERRLCSLVAVQNLM